MMLPSRKSLVALLTLWFHQVHAQTGYWQQECDYTIHVTLNDSSNFLQGDISISYTNNSPDSLHYIWFHLWPNAYKNTETAFARQQLENGETAFYFSEDKDKGFIDQLEFKVNNKNAVLQYDEKNIDIAKLILNDPLLPHRKINITTPFRVKIPKTVSRFGHVGQSYQITQWFPKPAVYDRFGWHQMPYLDQGEFYSEFGSFDVSITLPKNYVVGATGMLQNGDELLWLDSLSAATYQKFETTKAISNESAVDRLERHSSDDVFPPSAHETKTLHYKASNVHDFAWFADKRYHVMKSHVSLSNKKNEITTWTMFLDSHAALWKNAVQYVDSSVIYYSKWVGDYPYPQATAVEGALSAGDGMEYPMITVISGGFQGVKSLETVVAHEVGHNWFYGVLAFNEREHPWMDEGINSYYENRYVETRYPKEGLVPFTSPIASLFDLAPYSRGYQNYLAYIVQAYRHLDQPMDINAADFSLFNYPAIVYAKTAIVWKYLEAYLGTAAYDQLMQQFFDEWKFRHPYPVDIKNFFAEKTKKELDWLFDQSIGTKDYLDYKLVKAGDTSVIGNSSYQKLTVVNKREIKGPYEIDAISNGKVVKQVWYGGFTGKMDVLFPKGDYDAYRIDASMSLPEVNRKNNLVRTSGMLKNMERPRLQWLGSLDNPNRTQLFFTPTLGWNNYDKFWDGLALYNSVLPGKPLSFVLMPSYGFGSKRFIGLGQVNLQLFPKNDFIQRIDITASAKSFDYANSSFFGVEGDDEFRFVKLTQQVNVLFKKNFARSPVDQSARFRNIFIRTDDYSYPGSATPYSKYVINQLSYSLQNKRTLNPFGFTISVESGSQSKDDLYLKTYLEGNYRVSYPRKKFGLDLRLFTGYMLIQHANESYADFHLGPTTGTKDYRFDQLYFGRTESTGFLSQQVSIADDGGFKMRTDGVQPELGGSNSWIFSMNAKAPMPFFRSIFIFADAGFAPGNDLYSDFQFDAGPGISLISDFLNIYFPLLYSKDIKEQLNTTDFYDQWYKRISFTINLERLNPFEALRNIDRL